MKIDTDGGGVPESLPMGTSGQQTVSRKSKIKRQMTWSRETGSDSMGGGTSPRKSTELINKMKQVSGGSLPKKPHQRMRSSLVLRSPTNKQLMGSGEDQEKNQ